MKNILNQMNSFTTKLFVKGQLLRRDCKRLLTEERGSLTVEQIAWIIVIIVLITALVLPSVWKTMQGSLDGADSKLDDIWDYKG